MSSLSPGPDATRRIRPKLFWRLLFLLVCLLAAFLYAGFISLGGYLLMLGFDQEAAQPRRLLAFAGAALILLVGVAAQGGDAAQAGADRGGTRALTIVV